jgi:hypothetical protein
VDLPGVNQSSAIQMCRAKKDLSHKALSRQQKMSSRVRRKRHENSGRLKRNCYSNCYGKPAIQEGRYARKTGQPCNPHLMKIIQKIALTFDVLPISARIGIAPDRAAHERIAVSIQELYGCRFTYVLLQKVIDLRYPLIPLLR